MPVPAIRTIMPEDGAELRPARRHRRDPAADRHPDRLLRALPPAGRRRPRSATPPAWKACCKEIFPIKSYDGTISLEYIKYELGKPRYGPDECRQLRLTYGRPFRVWLRLNKQPEPVEEEVYLGDMPIMIGGGEFIINGAERVVVSQLHRSPGVDFVVEIEGDKKQHSCRIIPERGSWIEINVTKKETLGVRIDQSGKFSRHDAAARHGPGLLRRRRHPPRLLPDRDGRRSTRTPASKLRRPDGRRRRDRPGDGRGLPRVAARRSPTSSSTSSWPARSRRSPSLGKVKDEIILASLEEDPTSTHEEALLKIYQRLRPGNPPQLEKAKQLFEEKFQRPQPLPAGQGRPLPHQPEVRPGHPRERR